VKLILIFGYDYLIAAYMKLDHSYSADSNCVGNKKSRNSVSPSADVILNMNNVLPEPDNTYELDVENILTG
jgi:hypothetical protein